MVRASKVKPISPKPIVIGKKDFNQEKALIENLLEAYQCASDSDNSNNVPCNKFDADADSDKIEFFVDAGFALSNHYCDRYFRAVNRSARHRQFLRSTTNDVGGAVSAVLGLVEAGSAVTGGIAAGFSFLDSGYRNYEDSYVVDPNLAGLQALVKSAQHDMVIRSDANPPKNIFRALTRVEEYANICSFLGMQNLVDASVVDKTQATKEETKKASANAKRAGINNDSTEITQDDVEILLDKFPNIREMSGDPTINISDDSGSLINEKVNIIETVENESEIDRVGENAPPPPP